MELKVWCEGIQRVICGVTEATSCHDVVVALAQAMDRTGRYTLVEKWRESERLVSPDENPLLILHKWGEYASDVQFILRHSGAKDRPGSGGRHDDHSDPRRTSKLSYHNFTPHSMSESRSSSTSSLRKSLTFSGAHSHSLLVPKNGKLKNHAGSSGRGVNQNSSLESLTEQSSQSSHSQFNNSSGHSSFETRNRSRLQDSLSSQSSVSSLDNRNRSGLPLTRPSHAPPQPPTHGNIPFTYTNGSLDRTRKRHQASSPASVTIGNHRHQLSNSSTASSSSQLVPSPTGSVPRGSIEPPGRHRPSPPSLARLHKESNNNDVHYKPRSGGGGGLVTVAERGSEESSRQQGDDKRADLIKVINLQLEKLKAQQENIADVEKEIKFKEEREEKQKTEEERILSEIAVLQHQETDLDGEIQDLELVSWVDKLEMEQEKERRIKNEIETVRGKIQDCAEKLEEQEQLIKTLTADLEREETARSRELDQERQEEARVKREISEVKSQLIDRRAATDMQQSIIDKVATEVKVTEGLIRDKTAEVSELETQLKDSNMERFSKSPADWIRGSHEGRASFTNRPSSARRLESPQRLKETVATAKNPHGLWV